MDVLKLNRKNSILIFLLFFGWKSYGQYIIKESVVSASGAHDVYIASADYYLSYTVGETFITTLDAGSNYILTQGFHQPIKTRLVNGKKEELPLKFYTGFSPNGDGTNDIWEIDNINLYENNKVHIYNRWGDEVWSKEKYDNVKIVWEGRNKQNQDLPDGSYFYVIEAESLKSRQKGWVQITR